jgi:hypothetical protein
MAAILTMICSVEANAFSYSGFGGQDSLTLNGSSSVNGDALRLTPADYGKVGSAWQTEKQSITQGFSTTFQFLVTDHHPLYIGDGLAFVIQNTGTSALGDNGGCLAYSSWSRSVMPNCVAIEFDMWQNTNLDEPYVVSDPNNNHISVHTSGLLPRTSDQLYSIGSTTSIPLMADGNVHTVRIDYTPGSMRVFLDDLVNPSLTVDVDLQDAVGLSDGMAWIGFTAATGGAYENHDILSWSYQPVPEPSSILTLLCSLGGIVLKRRLS